MKFDKDTLMSNVFKYAAIPTLIVGVPYCTAGLVLKQIDRTHNKLGAPESVDLNHDFYGVFSPFAVELTPEQLELQQQRATPKVNKQLEGGPTM